MDKKWSGDGQINQTGSYGPNITTYLLYVELYQILQKLYTIDILMSFLSCCTHNLLFVRVTPCTGFAFHVVPFL